MKDGIVIFHSFCKSEVPLAFRFLCEYLLFELTLVVACVHVRNCNISSEMVGFTNNNIIIAWSQEVSYSYCDYSHHCASEIKSV